MIHHKHLEALSVILSGTGTIGILLTDIDILLKILVSTATLFYITLKIIKHFKNR